MANYEEKNQQQVENIRRQYQSNTMDKLRQLKTLDRKVKTPGKVTSTVLGVIGSLALGAGMSFIMVWGSMTTGLILGIPGMVAMLLAYPVYKLITGKRKKSYAPNIMQLSEELILEGMV